MWSQRRNRCFRHQTLKIEKSAQTQTNLSTSKKSFSITCHIDTRAYRQCDGITDRLIAFGHGKPTRFLRQEIKCKVLFLIGYKARLCRQEKGGGISLLREVLECLPQRVEISRWHTLFRKEVEIHSFCAA